MVVVSVQLQALVNVFLILDHPHSPFSPPSKSSFSVSSWAIVKKIAQNRWRVINRVKRKGKGYDVKQIHIWCAKLALSDEEFELLMRLLKTSSDAEIKEHRSAWIQLMHQGMGKGAEMGATRRTSLEWFNNI
jgi:hypothetical protein